MGSLSKILLFALLLANLCFAKNPIYSPTFDDIIKDTIGDDRYIFDDENIKVSVPQFADNPTQVPIFIDAKSIKDAKNLILFADLNPIPLIINWDLEKFLPIISFNIKVAQETPLRALIKDSKGVWHIGSANIKSFGGGCSVAATASTDKSFDALLGKSKYFLVKNNDTTRMKFNIYHPMETGLTFGASEFFINSVKVYDENDKELTSINTSSAISENPNILLETKHKSDSFNIVLKDTDFNDYEIELK